VVLNITPSEFANSNFNIGYNNVRPSGFPPLIVSDYNSRLMGENTEAAQQVNIFEIA